MSHLFQSFPALSTEKHGLEVSLIHLEKLVKSRQISHQHFVGQEVEVSYLRAYFFLLMGDALSAAHQIGLLKPQVSEEAFRLLEGQFLFETKQWALAEQMFLQMQAGKAKNFFLQRNLLKLYLKAKWYRKGQDFYQNMVSQQSWALPERLELLQLVSALYHLDYQFEESINIKREEFKLVLDIGLDKVNQNAQQPFSAKNAWQALTDIVEFFSKHQVTVFPTSGTLLGWEREGDLLPFDKDVDLGLAPETDFDWVRHLMETESRYQISDLLPIFSNHLSVTDLQTGVTIDLIGFWRQDNAMFSGWCLPEPFKDMSRVQQFTPFTLRETSWKDRTFYRPEDVDLFLTELYGDWQTPDPSYTGIISYNVEKITPLILSICYSQLFAFCTKKQLFKAKRMIQLLKEKGHEDAFLDDVLQAIEAL